MAASISRLHHPGCGWWRPCALSAGTGCHLSGLGPSGPVSLGGVPGDRSPGLKLPARLFGEARTRLVVWRMCPRSGAGEGRTDDPSRAWAAPAFGPEAGGASWAPGGEGVRSRRTALAQARGDLTEPGCHL